MTGWVLPMRIGIVIQKVIRDRIDYAPGNLSPARTIEVGDWKVVVTSIKGGELGADLLSG